MSLSSMTTPPLGRVRSFWKGSWNSKQPWVRASAVVGDVQPIALPQVAGLGPFVLRELDVPNPRAAFHLDPALRAVRPPGQEIEARAVREAGGSCERRRRHVADIRTMGFLVRLCQPHCGGLHLFVVSLPVLGSGGGHDEGVSKECHGPDIDEVRLPGQRGQGTRPSLAQCSLPILDSVSSGLARASPPRTRSLRAARAAANSASW